MTELKESSFESNSLLSNVKIKQEKIDQDVENRLKLLDVVVKDEIGSGQSIDEDSDSGSSEKSEQEDDKKTIVPVKSSNEILAELFGVFNAAPPVELLDDNSLLKKTVNQKKIKKEKKRKHKKIKSDGECSDSESTNSDGKVHKHKKKKKHKHKHKDSKDKDKIKDRDRGKSKDKDRAKSKDRHKEDKSKDREKQKDKTKDSEKRTTSPLRKANNDLPRDRKRQADVADENGPAVKTSRLERNTDREKERIHNSFYNGFREHDVPRMDNNERERIRPNSRIKRENIHRRNDHISDISLSDEETFLRERDTGSNRRGVASDASNRVNSFYGHMQRRDTEDRTELRNTRRERSRSRSRTPIDKKRLFEIARKNVINMVKHGKIPDSVKISQEAKEKLLNNWRYGGRTVDDLTEFCRKIANGDCSPELSSEEDSDVDKNGNPKAFHHPFQLKEREPIVMHIRNATPILPSQRSEDQTKAITMQFPVSSGQQHRMSEVWVPVEKKDTLAPLPALPPAKQSTNIFKDTTSKNVFEKTIPKSVQQEPAFKPIGVPTPTNANATPKDNVVPLPTPTSNTNLTISQPAQPTPISAATTAIKPPTVTIKETFVPEVPIPSTTNVKSDPVLSSVKPPSIDVSSVITKRLNAIRRLQENPMDPEALKMMYNAQRDMSSWASSKHLPGQFTGSTGANVMKAHELNSGPQLWARRDQLTSTKPVTGGMGMALLQKMGWKPGEGLGPAKTGSLQPLLLDVKLDKRGLVSREDHCHQQRVPSAVPRKTKVQPAAVNIQDKHPVCVLNELTSKNKWTPPQYTLINDQGPSHSRMFLFSVEINGQVYTPERASNTKKEAKFMAAKICLQQLGILPKS